jgi:hypothetical protein
MAPTCGALDRGNGTAVPNGITFRPFSTNLDGYKFGVLAAGHFKEW